MPSAPTDNSEATQVTQEADPPTASDPVVDTVQTNIVDGATAWIVIVALSGIAAIAYISKVNSALLADSVPREFATFVLSGGDALVDVASSLANNFDDYVKTTNTQLDDHALAMIKEFLAGLQKRE